MRTFTSKRILGLFSLLIPLVAYAAVKSGNLQLSGNTISSTDTNGNIILSPNGTGSVNIPGITASRAVVTDASNNLSASAATDTEVGYLSGVTSSLCGILQSCTETNKTFTAPAINGADLNFGTASNTNRLLLPSDTTTNLNLLTYTSGLLAFDTTLNKPVFNDGTQWTAVGSGSGAGGVDYVSNSDFESAIDAAKVFAFDDGTSYVDGTGGTPTSISIQRNSTLPLAGTNDLEIDKAASDCTGEGVTLTTETIDSFARGQNLNWQFAYDFSDSNYTSGDVQLKAYDVTNSQVLAVIPASGVDSSGGLYKQKTKAYVQVPTSSTTAQVRLSLYCNTDSATASTWAGHIDKADAAMFGPTSAVPGAIVTDWQDATCTSSWNTNTTLTCKKRRVGQNLELNIKLALSGAPNSTSDLTVTLPDSLSIDQNALLQGSTAARTSNFGNVVISDSSGSSYFGVAAQYSSTQVHLQYLSSNVRTAITSTAPVTFASGDTITAIVTVPISGWDAGASFSTTDLVHKSQSWSGHHDSTCAWSRTNTSFGDPTGDSTCTFTEDTNHSMGTVTSADDGTNKTPGIKFTPLAKAPYDICVDFTYFGPTTSGAVLAIQMVDGSTVLGSVTSQTPGTTAPDVSGHICGRLDVTAAMVGVAQTVKLQTKSSTGAIQIAGIEQGTQWKIDEKPDYKEWAARSENFGIHYTDNSGATIGTSGAKFTYTNKDFDPSGSYSSGVYTVKFPGSYRTHATLTSSGVSLSTSQSFNIRVLKNGSMVKENKIYGTGGGSLNYQVDVDYVSSYSVGDTIEIDAVSSVSSAARSSSGDLYNDLSITRVGN